MRLCIGPIEAVSPHLLPPSVSVEPVGAGAEHLCLTAFFAGEESEGVGGATAVHLVASSASQHEDWYMGLQALGGRLWPTDRISAGAVRWRSLALRMRAERRRAAGVGSGAAR